MSRRAAPADTNQVFQFFANHPLPMWVYDLETLRFLEVNEAAVAQYGYSRDEFLVMRITEIRPPEDVPRLIGHVAKDRPALQNSGEWRHRRKNGEVIDVYVISHTLDFRGRKAALVVAQDITERKRSDAALQESEERYRELYDNANDAIFTIDLAGRFTSINAKAARLTGYTLEEALAADITRVIPPEYLPMVRQMIQKKLAGGGATMYELEIVAKDGRRIPIELSSRLIRRDGRPVEIQGIARDMTERRQAEEDYRNLFERAPVGLCRITLSGEFLDANPALVQILGYPDRDALMGVNVVDLCIDQAVREQLRARLERTETVTIEAEMRRRDGVVIWVQNDARAVRDASGRVVHFEGVIQDITQRKQAAEVLRLAAIVESSGDAILTKTLDGIILTWNAAAERMYGYSAQEIIGRPVSILVPPDRPDEIPHILECLKRGEHFDHYETVRVRKDGTRFDVSLTISPIRDAAGTIIGASGISRDITETKRTQDALQRAKQEAERASQAKNEFLSRMSHELRTPMNAILGFSQLLEMDTLNPGQRESVDHILRGGRHLLELINEVLDIARIEAGRLSISLEPVPLGEVIQEALELIAPQADKAGIHVGSASGTPVRYVLADRQRIKQVLLNLLSNAVKYNHQGGTVTLSYEDTSEGGLRINVTDTGPGISVERMARLFLPFERLGAEQTGIEGTGLGLALSKRLVEAMGGRLGVDSAEGRGSTFWVEIAVADAAGVQPAEGRLEAPAPVAPGAPPSAHTILYVEDNLSNLELIQRLLARRPGVKLLPAMQGRIGLDLAREHHPDMILLDLRLPDIPGSEVLRRLRQDPETRGIPVVVISADATQVQIDRLLAQGARAYLTKPLDIKEFLALVNEILTGGAPL
jgi:PAS domain S-box-containing protein